MRKNILSLSIAAMIGGLGLAGGASAGVFTTGATASDLVVAPEGVGHILLVPHYTAQSNNMSLLNIVNTDVDNGKVVKVRFRGAANSDDVLDFLLFLSPGDVWAGNVSKHADGMAFLSTPDNSCVLPQSVKTNGAAGSKFITSRVNPIGGAAGRAEETLEGYVEILNTADIPESTKPLFTTTKHKSDGSVECAKASLDDYFRTEITDEAVALTIGLSFPTGGLFANWSIFNVTDASAWTGAATAVAAVAEGVPAPANMVVFPQTAALPDGLTSANIDTLTADPLASNVNSAGLFQLQTYDLPDLSTPYVTTSGTSAALQAATLSAALAKSDIKNEYITDSTVQATTDWIFSMPTRRYAVAVNYTQANASGATGNDGLVFNPLNANYFDEDVNVNISSVINGKKLACVDVAGVQFWDRSERTPGTPDDEIVISPTEPGEETKYNFCGEVSIWSFGATGAKTTLNGLVSTKNADIPYTDGWAKFTTPGATGAGLPILGYSVMKFLNGPMGYGLTFPHRYTQGKESPPKGGGGGIGGGGGGIGGGGGGGGGGNIDDPSAPED